jgi:hypothetical protein
MHTIDDLINALMVLVGAYGLWVLVRSIVAWYHQGQINDRMAKYQRWLKEVPTMPPFKQYQAQRFIADVIHRRNPEFRGPWEQLP